MPHTTRTRYPAAQDPSPDHEQQAGSHLKQQLRASLQDTRSLLQAWTHSQQTETLHQARVAWRRQKCLLKFYKPLLPEPPQRHRQALQTLWHLTGQLRNLDVALESTLPTWRQNHPEVGAKEWPALVQQLHRDRLLTRDAVAQEIIRPRITAGFHQLHTWMKRLDTAPLKVQGQSFEKWTQQRLKHLHKKIQSQRHPFTPERQHRCRILLKQERHALESLLMTRHDKRSQTQLKRVRKKQIAWGQDQDMQATLNLIERPGLYPELTQAWRASM